jgi:hypothetical protein
MELYNIYWNDGCGNRDLVATTNNLDRWLKDHNKRRIADGEEPESLDDFEFEDCAFFFYEGGSSNLLTFSL